MTDPTKRSSLSRYVIATLVALALIGLYIAAKRWLDIDRCLDRGGAWDYDNKSLRRPRLENRPDIRLAPTENLRLAATNVWK
jgi:hypothetical protein